VTAIADRLVNALSVHLAGAGLHAEAVAPAQAGVDLLRGFAPPPTAQTEYLALLAGALHTLALRLIGAGRVDEAGSPVAEAVQIYRQLVEVNPGAFRPLLEAVEQLAASLR
jgi:hypothetical protein